MAHIEMNKTEESEEQHRFVERVFDTFSWRSMPEEIWLGYEDNWEYDWYNDGFDPFIHEHLTFKSLKPTPSRAKEIGFV